MVPLLPAGAPPLCSRAIIGADKGARAGVFRTGMARTVGTDSEDPSCDESDNEPERRTCSGALGVWKVPGLMQKMRMSYILPGVRFESIAPISFFRVVPTTLPFTSTWCSCTEDEGSAYFQVIWISCDEMSSSVTSGAGGMSSPSFSTRTSFGVVMTE